MMLSSFASTSEIDRAFALVADGSPVEPLDVGGFDTVACYICDCWFEGARSPRSQAARVLLPNAA